MFNLKGVIMLDYFNCCTSKNELYKYENIKQELRENGLGDKKEIKKDYKKEQERNKNVK